MSNAGISCGCRGHRKQILRLYCEAPRRSVDMTVHSASSIQSYSGPRVAARPFFLVARSHASSVLKFFQRGGDTLWSIPDGATYPNERKFSAVPPINNRSYAGVAQFSNVSVSQKTGDSVFRYFCRHESHDGTFRQADVTLNQQKVRTLIGAFCGHARPINGHLAQVSWHPFFASPATGAQFPRVASATMFFPGLPYG
jgi:hypothetical protein